MSSRSVTPVRGGLQKAQFADLPTPWGLERLGTLTSLVTSGSRGWSQYYSEAGSLFLRITNLTRDSIDLDLSDCKFVSLPTKATEGSRTKVQAGDVLISITADLGVIGVIPEQGFDDAYVNQHIALARLDKNRLDPRFCSYFLASTLGQKQFNFLNDSGAKAGLNLPSIRRVFVPLPPLAEQKKIAAVLSSVDRVIEKTQAVIDQTERVKQGLMQKLLTRGIGHTKFKKTKIGEIPESWEVIEIADLATTQKNSFTIGPFGSNLKVNDYCESGKPVTFVRDVRDGVFVWRSKVYVSPEKAEELDAHRVEPGDIVFTKMGLPPGIAVVYPSWMPTGIITADILRLKPNPNLCRPDFVAAVVNSKTCQNQVGTITGGLTRPKITLRDFKKILVPLPPIKEQKKIATVLGSLLQAIEKSSVVIRATHELKRGLMQDLLTGRRRCN